MTQEPNFLFFLLPILHLNQPHQMLQSLKLTNKIKALLVVIVVILTAFTFTLSYKIKQESNALLLQKLKDTKEIELPRITKIHDGLISNLIIDYSSWNQSASFAEGKLSEEWADEEYKNSLGKYGVTHIWVFNLSEEQIYISLPDSNRRNEQYVPSANLFDSLKNSSYLKFYKNYYGKIIEKWPIHIRSLINISRSLPII